VFTTLRRFAPQQMVAAGSVLVAGALSLGIWVVEPIDGRATRNGSVTLLALALLAALLLAYQFPIHIRLSGKVYMSTVVYFLMAMLLPVPLALGTAGLGSLGC